MNTSSYGFTRLELLVVSVILIVLVGVVVISLNPGRQFTQARDNQRYSDVQSLADAFNKRLADTKNRWNASGTSSYDRDCAPLPPIGTVTVISASEFDAYDCLVPQYLPKMVADPGRPAIISSTQPQWDTGYTIERLQNGRITISAPYAELEKDISVSR